MYKTIQSAFSLLLLIIVVLFNNRAAQADFLMEISIVGPTSPLIAGDIVNLDFNISFTSDDLTEMTNSITFGFFTTTPELTNDLTRFSAVNEFWTGGFDTVNGIGNFTADVDNEIFNSNMPQPVTVGRIEINTVGLNLGNYNLEVQSIAWLVTGSADGETLLFDGDDVAGSGNSITFNPLVSFTISAVPEPSSIALVAVITCLSCFARGRRISTYA